VMIQGCERWPWPRCRPSTTTAWRFIRLAVRTPFAGSRSLVHRLGVPSPPVRPLVPVLPWPPAPWTKGKGVASSAFAQVLWGFGGGEGRRLRRADGSLVSEPSQKRQRTADGTEGANSQAPGV
jgi:hypothetical protein